MAKISKIQIVEDDQLFRSSDILETIINEDFNNFETTEVEDANIFIARCSLIRNKQFCSRCEDIPRMRYVKRKKSLDGYI
jgi:hypothetical protein